MMEKWEDKKNFVFSHVCLVGRVESERVKNSFILLERKVGGWKM